MVSDAEIIDMVLRAVSKVGRGEASKELAGKELMEQLFNAAKASTGSEMAVALVWSRPLHQDDGA